MKSSSNIKSFLICHIGALGDFILTWPALHCLRRALPDYEFLGIGRPEYMRLAITLGLLDTCLDKESARLLDFFSGRAIPPEIGSPHGAVLWLSRGKNVIDLLEKSALLPVISIKPFPVLQTHIASYYCSTILSHFPINIPKNLSDCFPYRTRKGQYVLIHPGSGGSMKNFLPQFYRGLAEELRKLGCRKVSFIFGPVEREKMTIEDFAGERIEQPENVEELANLLSDALIYIGNDSGVSHLSAYLGIPTITLYKTTDPGIWGTLGRKVVHISAANEESAKIMIREYLERYILEIF